MIHVGLTAEDFNSVMHGWKRQLIVPRAKFTEPARSGDIVRIGMEEHGTGHPSIDCIVTHVEECTIAAFHPDTEEILSATDSVILSITRGIKW